MFLLFLFLLVIILFFVYLYVSLRKNYNYWKERNVAYIEPSIVGGNTLPVLLLQKSIGNCLAELHEKSNEPFVGILTINQPGLLIRDKELIKAILIKDFHHFVDRNAFPEGMESVEPVGAKSIMMLRGDKWRKLRVRLTPTFTSGKMKNMFYLVRAQAERLEPLFEEYAEDSNAKSFPTKNIFMRYTTDVIATCAFGINGKAIDDPNWEILGIAQKAVKGSALAKILLVLIFAMPWLVKLFKLRVFSDEYYDLIRNAIWSTALQRQQNKEYRHDFLDLLLEIREQTLSEKETDPTVDVLDGDALVAQAFVFLVAGVETSAHTTSLVLYEMARNPEIQAKVHEEIHSVLAKYNGEITYDGLKEMKYLKQCIDETLRLYPPLPFLERICTTEYPIPNSKHIIEPGMHIMISTLSLHKDPAVFPNPEQFDPDRFAEDKINDYKMSYLPFGDGPRNCIGMRFGIMQTKTALVQILKNYRIEPAADTPIPVKFDMKEFTTIIDGDLPLALKKL